MAVVIGRQKNNFNDRQIRTSNNCHLKFVVKIL